MYVYQWCYPNGLPFYVGMGVRNRMYAMRGRSKAVREIVRKIEASGHEVIREKIRDNLTFGQAQKLEIDTIAKYGRRCKGNGILANVLEGGECPGSRVPARPKAEKKVVKRTASSYTDPAKVQHRAKMAQTGRALRSASYRTRKTYGKR
jgi:hypothetical protein